MVFKCGHLEKNRILCVILHYGDEQITFDCVNSIISYDFLDILIVDNDPSQKIIIPPNLLNKICIFRTGGEACFAQANNMAVSIGRNVNHHAVLLLNNDMIVIDGAIDMLRKLLNQENVGACGPCISFASCPDKIWACGGFIDKLRLVIGGLETIARPEPYDVDYLPGAAILCRFDVWDMVGGLPEKYCFCYEEAEFALRIKKIKFRIMVHPKAHILHKVGMSSDNQPMYIYNSIRNRIRFGGYLWGTLPGYLLGAFWSLKDMMRVKYGIALWTHAVRDEICGAELNRKMLQNINKLFYR